MKKTVQIETELLQKFAEFTTAVMRELADLRASKDYSLRKQAEQEEERERYLASVVKVADALHDSDFDFVTGDFNRQQFIKRAMQDPSYLARTLEKVCNAADVSLIGKPARVAATKSKAIIDPVYARAFGYSKEAEFFTMLDD